MVHRDGFIPFIGALVLVGTMVSCSEAEAGDFVHANPYLEVGVAYAFDTPYGQSMDDEYYSWKGSNPVFIGAAGIEVRWKQNQKGHLDLGFTHISNWFTGFPFNNDGETGLDMVHIKYRWRF